MEIKNIELREYYCDFINNRINTYKRYKNSKFDIKTYEDMIVFFNSIKNDYSVKLESRLYAEYILDVVEKKYRKAFNIRKLKIEKINELYDSNN